MAIRGKKIQSSKMEAVEALRSQINASSDFIFTDYRGLTVFQISQLRKQLRAKNAEYHVVKNNFARLAFEELGFTKEVVPVLLGPTAVAFVKSDSNEVARILVDFARDAPLKVKGGLVDKDFLDQKAITLYSKLPGRNQLIAMFMSTMRAPVQNFVYLLKAVEEKVAAQG
ncbi:MAG: 50S ribosomal protein L10 [Spirochaetes bacterium]|nr:50S ribosomal protein L10 [Spirochaetota bacterium]